MQYIPSQSKHPKNPYRDPRARSVSVPLQQRLTVLFGACCLIGFIFVLTYSSNTIRSSTSTPPLENANIKASPPGVPLFAPRIRGGEAADKLNKPTNLKIMTFNLRFASANDGYNSWRFRKDHLIEIINRYHPAVMGTQEGLKDQLAEIASKLEHPYERYGIERETNGEFEQIFYDTNIVKWLDGGNFWISEDPDTPGTKGWDAACVRLVTWSKFRLLATRQEFFFFNTQLDHVGEKSRNEGSKLLWGRIQRITQTKDKPFFLLGDFNTYRHTSTYAYFTSEEKGPQLLEAWKEAKNKIGTVSYTYHGWAGIQNDGEKGAEVAANHIDWIFYRPEMKVLSCEVITESRDGRYPSDHYPIQAEFLFPSPQELLPPPL